MYIYYIEPPLILDHAPEIGTSLKLSLRVNGPRILIWYELPATPTSQLLADHSTPRNLDSFVSCTFKMALHSAGIRYHFEINLRLGTNYIWLASLCDRTSCPLRNRGDHSIAQVDPFTWLFVLICNLIEAKGGLASYN